MWAVMVMRIIQTARMVCGEGETPAATVMGDCTIQVGIIPHVDLTAELQHRTAIARRIVVMKMVIPIVVAMGQDQITLD